MSFANETQRAEHAAISATLLKAAEANLDLLRPDLEGEDRQINLALYAIELGLGAALIAKVSSEVLAYALGLAAGRMFGQQTEESADRLGDCLSIGVNNGETWTRSAFQPGGRA